MLRIVGLVICSLIVAFTVMAAPAPIYKPDRTRWLGMDGWDKPVDRVGDCLFDREGNSLTITLPASTLPIRPPIDRKERSSYLTREVVGDFTMEVRVGGDLCPADDYNIRRTGITILFGRDFWHFYRVAVTRGRSLDDWWRVDQYDATKKSWRNDQDKVKKCGKSGYLRVERIGHQLLASYSENGKDWTETSTTGRKEWRFGDKTGDLTLPRKLTVGVFASATADSTTNSKAVFDKFKLIQATRER